MLAEENNGEFGNSSSKTLNILKRILTQFTKALPSKYTGTVISPKFHPPNILRYTVINEFQASMVH